jgi:hypothetical protein
MANQMGNKQTKPACALAYRNTIEFYDANLRVIDTLSTEHSIKHLAYLNSETLAVTTNTPGCDFLLNVPQRKIMSTKIPYNIKKVMSNKHLILEHEEKYYIWDIQQQKTTLELDKLHFTIINPRLLLCSSPKGLHLWDVTTNVCKQQIQFDNNDLYIKHYRGTTVIIVDKASVQLWDVAYSRNISSINITYDVRKIICFHSKIAIICNDAILITDSVLSRVIYDIPFLLDDQEHVYVKAMGKNMIIIVEGNKITTFNIRTGNIIAKYHISYRWYQSFDLTKTFKVLSTMKLDESRLILSQCVLEYTEDDVSHIMLCEVSDTAISVQILKKNTEYNHALSLLNRNTIERNVDISDPLSASAAFSDILFVF